MKHETYILSKKLYNVANIYTKSVWVKSYNMYIIGDLSVILEDPDIMLKLLLFFSR